jgi:hypothetical protein
MIAIGFKGGDSTGRQDFIQVVVFQKDSGWFPDLPPVLQTGAGRNCTPQGALLESNRPGCLRALAPGAQLNRSAR